MGYLVKENKCLEKIDMPFLSKSITIHTSGFHEDNILFTASDYGLSSFDDYEIASAVLVVPWQTQIMSVTKTPTEIIVGIKYDTFPSYETSGKLNILLVKNKDV